MMNLDYMYLTLIVIFRHRAAITGRSLLSFLRMHQMNQMTGNSCVKFAPRRFEKDI